MSLMWEKIPGFLPLFCTASDGKLCWGQGTKRRLLYVHSKWLQASKQTLHMHVLHQANITHACASCSQASVGSAWPIMQCDYVKMFKWWRIAQNTSQRRTNTDTCSEHYSKWNVKIEWYKPMHSETLYLGGDDPPTVLCSPQLLWHCYGCMCFMQDG